MAADQLHYLEDFLPNLGAVTSLWAAKNYGLGQPDSIVGLGAAGMLIYSAGRTGPGA
ncbi:MAG: ferrous-iron efflux pump FieF [Paracoccaceae bacterium]|jgi:ferrous-iron efflux pump FieF